MRNYRIALALLLAALSSGLHAVTYIVPPDREMIQLSDDIVIATGVTSLVEQTGRGGIVTRYTLRIEEVLKGERTAGDHLVLTERGGRIGERMQLIPGTPSYEPGERYLVFTDANASGEPVTFGMGLGQFFFAERPDRRLALRAEIEGFNHNLGSHVEQARDAAQFLEYIRGIVAQKIDPEPRYFVQHANARIAAEYVRPIASEATRGSYLLTADGRPFRWSPPTASFVKSGTPVGADGNTAVALAFAQWNGTDSDIAYTDAGQDNSALGGLEDTDGKNAILFNDPNGDVGNGIAGIGGITAGDNPYNLDGETFWNMNEVDVVMNNGSFAQNCYNTVMVHEIGHTLGFRHSNQNSTSNGACTAPAVCTSNAIMNSSVQCSWKGILMEYDRFAADVVYGDGIACDEPQITDQPRSTSVRTGKGVRLTVEATGTGPLTYQWFQGARGDVSEPVGTGQVFNSPELTISTAYWVRVSNDCGSADSNTAFVGITSGARRRAARHP